MSRPAKHPYLPQLVEQFKRNEVDRREFLRTATLLGVSVSAAFSLAGLPAPAQAQAQAAKPRGGTLRISTTVYDVKSPPTATSTAHPLI